MAVVWKHLKQQWSRYRAWQLDPTLGDEHSDRVVRHHCANCGIEFTGDYCYHCGQCAGTGRITWASVRHGVMDLWGLGTRSLPYTLWQLIWRPGYLIGDYLRGRRQLSFPPVKMLVLVALFIYVLFSLLPSEQESEVIDQGDSFEVFLELFFQWFSKHLDWTALILTSTFILPTYFTFKYSLRFTHHTLPEGFFIQVFNSTWLLLFGALFTLASALPIPFSTQTHNTLFISLLFLLLYRVYKQLFGYGWWGTFWRLALVMLGSFLIFTIAINLCYIVYVTYNHLDYGAGRSSSAAVMRILIGITVLAVSLAISWCIDRYIAKKHSIA